MSSTICITTVQQLIADLLDIFGNDHDCADNISTTELLKLSVIEGSSVRLIPYTIKHVETYHQWLNDKWIQEMTNTKVISLSEEYESQKEWKTNDQKYIFIIIDKSRLMMNETSNAIFVEERKNGTEMNEVKAMAGDINIFMYEMLEEMQCDIENKTYFAELNIMIADERSRRKGLTKETLKLIIKWVNEIFHIQQFVAKIQSKNIASIQLFRGLGFVETHFEKVFDEYTLTFDI